MYKTSEAVAIEGIQELVSIIDKLKQEMASLKAGLQKPSPTKKKKV